MAETQGPVIIVTGGATLLGTGIVEALRSRGALVTIADIDEGGGEALATSDPSKSCPVEWCNDPGQQT